MGTYFTASTYTVTDGNIVYGSDLNTPFSAIDAAFTSIASNIQTGAGLKYASDTGVANAYTVALTPAIASYAEGLEVWLKPANTNTGASTLAVNGLTAISIKRFGFQTLEAGDILANYFVHLKYSGGYFQIVSTAGDPASSAESSATDAAASAAAALASEVAAEAAAATLDIGSFTAEGNSGATLAIDTNTEVHSFTLSEACTLTFSNWPASGTHRSVMLVITNPGAYVITWPAAVKWPGGAEPSWTPSGRDRVVLCTEDGGTTIDANSGGADFS